MQEKSSNIVKIKYPPSRKKIIEILSEISKICKERKSPFNDNILKIILFGSYAKNEQHFGSDVDLLFVLKENSEIGFDEIYEFLMENWPDFEWTPQVMTKKEIKKSLESNTFWLQSAISEGIEFLVD